MTQERSAEDVVSGVLRIAVGREVRSVPTLSIAQTRVWQQQIGRGPGGFVVPVSDDDWTASKMAEFAGLSVDTLLDVVVAYDVSGALGGREWLEQNADPHQIYQAAIQMAEVAYPFADNLPVLLAGLVVARVVESTRPRSMSGPSPTGVSTRGRSTKRSTRAS